MTTYLSMRFALDTNHHVLRFGYFTNMTSLCRSNVHDVARRPPSRTLNNDAFASPQGPSAPIIPPRPGPVANVSSQPVPSLRSKPPVPQLPPRGSKQPETSRQSSQSDAAPPPRPPKSVAPPLPLRNPNNQHLPQTSQATFGLDDNNSSLDEKIARLMEMGYSFEHVNRALAISHNNLTLAVQILQSFVPTFT